MKEMKRRDAYERSQELKRIQAETERSRALMDQRKQLQDQRRLANMTASMQRQQIVQVGRGEACCHAASCVPQLSLAHRAQRAHCSSPCPQAMEKLATTKTLINRDVSLDSLLKK